MRCFRIGSLALSIGLLAGAAAAECLVCDEVVELNEPTATCFLEQFDSLVASLEDSETGYVPVNVGDCEGMDTGATRGGLLTMPGLDQPARERRLKAVYLFDKTYMLCLRDLLAEVSRPIDPVVELDLYESCQP